MHKVYSCQSFPSAGISHDHYFDPEYSLKCCKAAANTGTSGLVLCDTNGGSMPRDVGSITSKIISEFEEVDRSSCS